jgi:hypothetical protein
VNRRLLAALAFCATLIASCVSIEQSQYDWCYIYELDQPGLVNIAAGEFRTATLDLPVGGIRTVDGELSISYIEAFDVAPAAIEIVAYKEIFPGNTTILGAGDVFGVSSFFGPVSVPGSQGILETSFLAQPGNTGNTLNITIQSDNPILLHQIGVYGMGSSPYPTNPCAPSGPQPTPPNPSRTPIFTYTPSNTPTATLSRTPSLTPTPSETATPQNTNTPQSTTTPLPGSDWCFLFNATTTPSLGDWAVSGKGTWTGTFWQGVSSTAGGSTPNNSVGILYDFGASTTIKSVQAFMFMSQNGAIGGPVAYLSDKTTSSFKFHDFSVSNGTISPTWTGTRTLTRLGMWANSARDHNLTVTNGADTRINAVRIYGAGTNPFGYDNCNLTPTPSNTPTASSTPTPTPSNTPSLTPTRTGIASGTPRPGVGDGPTWTPLFGATRTPSVTPTPNLTATQARQDLMTAIASFTFVPPTLIASPTLRSTFVSPTPGGPTATPGGPTSGDDGGGGFFWGVGLGLFGDLLNLFGAFINWVANIIGQFFSFLEQIINWVIASLQNLLITIGNFAQGVGAWLQSALNTALEILEIVRYIIEIVIRLVALVASWTVQTVGRFGVLISSYYTAPTVPIPGLHLCVSAPTQHDICAIFWILDYTLLAQGTPGALIVPLTVVLINLSTLFRTLTAILRIIRRGNNVTSA